MKKRLHDQGIWRKPWFRGLSKDAKLLWLYICDECDCCGVYERDDEQLKFYLQIKEIPFSDLGKNIFFFSCKKKILVKDFCEFQYGLPEKYKETSNLHKNILNRLIYHKLNLSIIERLKNKSTVTPTVAPTVNISISKSISINKSINKSKNQFIPPTVEQVKEYFLREGYPEFLAERFFKGYSEANPPWTDSKGKEIRSWKQKAQQVWFRDENKTTKIKPDLSREESYRLFKDKKLKEEKERILQKQEINSEIRRAQNTIRDGTGEQSIGDILKGMQK